MRFTDGIDIFFNFLRLNPTEDGDILGGVESRHSWVGNHRGWKEASDSRDGSERQEAM